MDTLGDRYELGALLGSGGMARVYRARDLVLDRSVAVKVLRSDLVAETINRQRFLREARTAAAFSHPNAVTVLDADMDGDTPYLVMELVEGTDLARVLADRGPLPPGEVVDLMTALLDALGAAHAAGLVHRDIKPANVLIADGEVKVADFGIARSLTDAASSLTAAGTLLGTPRYVSPEQVDGARATAASDLYAVGVVTYEALSGRVPFEAETPLAIALAHTRDVPRPLADIAPHVPTALADVVMRALEKDPGDRPVSAGEMARALRAARPVGATVHRTGAGRDDMGTAVGPGHRSDGHRPAWLVPAGVLAAAGIAIAIGAALIGGDDSAAANGVDDVTASQPAPGDTDPTEPDDAPDPEPEPEPEPEPDPEPEPEPEPDPEPDVDATTLLDELAARLDVDDASDRWGERAGDLRDDLLDVSGRSERSQRDAARSLAWRIDTWLRDEEIDDGIGREAIGLVAEVSRRTDVPPPDDAPGDLPALRDLLAEGGEDVWGEEADDLAEDIDDLLDQSGRDRREDAWELADEVDEWIDDGDLDPAIGVVAIDLLTAEALVDAGEPG